MLIGLEVPLRSTDHRPQDVMRRGSFKCDNMKHPHRPRTFECKQKETDSTSRQTQKTPKQLHPDPKPAAQPQPISSRISSLSKLPYPTLTNTLASRHLQHRHPSGPKNDPTVRANPTQPAKGGRNPYETAHSRSASRM